MPQSTCCRRSIPIPLRAALRPTYNLANPLSTLRLPISVPAMGSEPRRSLLVGRRGLLFGLLAVLVVVLIVEWNDLVLAYRMNSAERAIRSRDWSSAVAILERSSQRGESSPRWHYLLARSQRRAGLVSQAEQHLVRAASQTHRRVDALRESPRPPAGRGAGSIGLGVACLAVWPCGVP